MVANVACAGIVFLTSHAHKSEEVTLRSGGQLCASCASISVIFCACTGKQRARLVICSSKHPFAFTPLSRSSSTNTQAHTLQTLSLPAAGENLRPATAARLQSCWHFGIFDPSSFTTFPTRASGAKFKLRTLAQQRVPAARTAAFSSLSPRGQGFCFSEPTPRLPPMPRCGTIAFQLHISYAHRNHDRICAGTKFSAAQPEAAVSSQKEARCLQEWRNTYWNASLQPRRVSLSLLRAHQTEKVDGSGGYHPVHSNGAFFCLVWAFLPPPCLRPSSGDTPLTDPK